MKKIWDFKSRVQGYPDLLVNKVLAGVQFTDRKSALRQKPKCARKYCPLSHNTVSQCEICRAHETSQQKEKLRPHEIPDRPWSKVAVDLFELNNRHYLVTVDYYSNYWEVDRMESSTTSKAVILKLKQQFARHGIPNTVFSDNGPQFDSDEFRRFAPVWEFSHVTSSPGYAQSNRMVESAVKTVKRLIKKANEDNTEGMNSSPAQRLLSRRTRTLLPTSEKLLKPQLAEGVLEEKKKIKSKQALYYNQNARDLPSLKKGDTVRIQPIKSAKEPWKKATVQEQVNVRSYKVVTEAGSTLRRNRRHLKATREPPVEPTLPEQIAPSQTEESAIQKNNTETGQSSPTKETFPAPAITEPTPQVTRCGRVVKPPSYLNDYVR